MNKRKTTKRANPAYPQRVARQAAQDAREVKSARAARPSSRDKAVRVSRKAIHAMDQNELAALGLTRMGSHVVVARPFRAPVLSPGVIPRNPRDTTRFRRLPGERPYMALDSAMVAPTYAWANQYCSAVGFPGYPYLAELALRSEYRSPAETTAKEMTRRWLKLKSASAGDKKARIETMDQAIRDFKIRQLWKKAVENDYFFGRYDLYLDIKGQDSDMARQRPLKIDPATLGKDCLLGVSGIEPLWMTPYSYNSTDPTAPDFFKPTSMFCLGRKTHSTRFLTFISRPVPDLFKPAYNFGGLSMSQLMEPYVLQWYRTRDAVSDLVYNYSTSGIATNLATLLEEDEDGSTVRERADFFNKTKGNRGLLLVDKDTEEFFQYNVPLSGLDKLQAQAQEHMAAPSHTPLVKLTGITPSGLNASSEGEIEVYNDFLHSEQEGTNDNMDLFLDVLQIHLFGDIDEDITYDWVPLREPTSVELAKIRADDAQAGTAYITNGVIAPEEERERLQSDPNSGYNNLNGPPPEMPEEPTAEETAGLEEEGKQADHERAKDLASHEAKVAPKPKPAAK
jgi:phage-related protein (TIGR01555 family)